ncbi:MAG: type II toxin-antitoxin system RelE/ParE family toxin [Spirochaetales bacterium]|nr:type II toxin-antitoxin system RelE/ParE family toxin [Spirochaetales bacterium]
MFTIKFEGRSFKELGRLKKEDRDRVLKAIKQLQVNPRPVGCRKLKNREGWRVRIGDYRVIYTIHDDELIILILKVGHRKEVYDH